MPSGRAARLGIGLLWGANLLAAAGVLVWAVAGPPTDLFATNHAAGVLAAVASLVFRFRRSTGVQRLQLKWITAAALALGALFASGPLYFFAADRPEWVWTGLVAVGLASLPDAAGRAMLRYRLYEIDRLLSRTVSYAVVTGVLVAVYAGAVLLLAA